MKTPLIAAVILSLLPVQAAPALLGLHATATQSAVQQAFAAHIAPGTGLTITRLVPGTPAEKRLRLGDVLLRADSTLLHTPDELASIVRQKQAGDTLQLVLLRNGALMEISLPLAERPEQPVLNREQQLELNKLLLLLAPPDNADVDTPAVRRQLLLLSECGLAQKDEYATCTLHLCHEQYLITITSSERSLRIVSNHPEVPDASLRADYYRRDTKRLPEKLEQMLLLAEYYRP